MGVSVQRLLIELIPFPCNVAGMVVADQHRPLSLIAPTVMFGFTGTTIDDARSRSRSPEGVGASVTGVRQNASNGVVAGYFPNSFAIHRSHGNRQLLLAKPQKDLTRTAQFVHFLKH
jgi:hypothetical protein